ncbi:MAG: N-6 DNA methylase [Planctomycetes bacterium]|nr:N-6 DNA methylase [Planctomycetota bacterium]
MKRHSGSEPTSRDAQGSLSRLGKPGSASENSSNLAGLWAIHQLAELARKRWPRRREAIARAFASSEKALGQDGLLWYYAECFEWYSQGLDILDVDQATDHISLSYENSLGLLTEQSANKRTTQGAFYTPETLVDHLVERTVVDGGFEKMPRICDPACGTGNFLVLAGSALGESRRAWQSLYGTDIDLAAVLICRWRIWIASGCDPEVWKHVCKNICVGDSLGGPPPALTGAALREWQRQSPTPPSNGHTWAKTKELQRGGKWRGFDVILGNPPFLSQLSASTTHDAARQAWLKYRFGGLVGAYTDAAALFLALAVEHLAPGGKLGLVLPSSVLATRDCAAVRRFVAEETRIRSVWVNPARAFYGVNVLTCALVAERIAEKGGEGKRPQRIQTYVNQGAAKGEVLKISATEMREMPTWGVFTRGLSGLPQIVVKRVRTLGDLAQATAYFRDQYYGLKGHISEGDTWDDENRAPLITSGLIDLGRIHWETRATRVLKEEWTRPVVDVKSLSEDAGMRKWVEQRRVPKVLLPTQTRVLEPWVDEAGVALPCVPVITVVPRSRAADELWLIGAVLASPVVSAIARIEAAGAALSAEAIKLSAKQCLGLPQPKEATWAEVAARFREVCGDGAKQETLQQFGEVAIRAYDLPAGVGKRIMEWWLPKAMQSRFGAERGQTAAQSGRVEAPKGALSRA